MATSHVRVSPAKLRQAYKESGISQRALADRVGFHFTTVSRHLHGHRSFEDIGTLARYAEALGKSIDFFLVNGDDEEGEDDDEEADSDLAADLKFLADFKAWVTRSGAHV